MAAIGERINTGVNVKGRETQNINGLISPGGTPEVEDARIEAEKQRQAAVEAARALANSKPPPDDPLSDGEDDEEKSKPTEEQRRTIQEVLKCNPKEYRKILGVQDNEDEEGILSAFRELATSIHPDYIKGKDTQKAFDRVLKAAKGLDIEKEDINEVKTWDGTEDLNGDGDMDGIEKEIPWPSPFVQDIYLQATPYLATLCRDSTNLGALTALKALNNKITEQNEKDGITPEQWTIDFTMFGAQFNSMKPHYDKLLNTPPGQPLDKAAVKKIEDTNTALTKIIDQYHFPKAWVISVPTEESRAAAQASRNALEEAKRREADAKAKPNDSIKEIHKKAEPYFQYLMNCSKDSYALNELQGLNEKIKEQNEKDGVSPADRWAIDIGGLAAYLGLAKPLIDRLSFMREGPYDEAAKDELEKLNAERAKVNTEKGYPDTWVVSIPTPEQRAKAAADQAAIDKLAQEETERVAAKLAAAKFGNIKFPWVTHLLPTGERIISGRQKTMNDVAGSLCCVELPCTDPEKPIFRFRDDIDINELKKYFATPGIKLMGETDEQGRPVKVWRKKDRPDFRNFLFCVVWKGGRSDTTRMTKPKCPETLCCFMTVRGIELANRSGFKNLVGLKAGDGYIRIYCEDMGITAPWDVASTSFIITPEDKVILDKVRAGTTANLVAGYSISGLTAINSPSARSESLEIKLLQDQMANLERKFSNFQPSTIGSLDSILAKLDERMASIENTNTKLAGYLSALSDRFGKLEEQVQL